MVIERGASNTLVVMGRVTLSPSYWLLHFTDIERGGNAYCVVQAGNSSASFISLTFTETTSPVALDGEVLLSPAGNWNLKIYEQTSSTNLAPASAGRLVKDVDVFVDGAGVADSGWTETCPTDGDCDPLSVRVNGEPYGTVADPCGGVASVTVNQGGVPVGSLVGGVWVVPECPACDDLTVTVNGTTYGTVADPCGATAAVDVHDSNGNDVGSLVSGAWVVAPPANVLHEYTTGGTWNKPTDPSFRGVWVFAAGAGGAGGAGGASNNVYGGGGGGGGAIVRLWIPAASLGLTETYAIGAGAVSVATGNGGAGGATLFGAHVDAQGGSGGIQGAFSPQPIQVAGGSALLCVPVTGSAISGALGGRGRREPATYPEPGSAVIASILTISGHTTTSPIAAGGAGGGAGGGWRATIATGTDGGDGGGCYQGGSLTTGGAGGAVGGNNGTAGANDIYIDPFLGLVTTTIGLGTGGGGGGGASGATAGGTGAAGGRAAGGGGGGSTQTGTRGASGAGGNGFLIVYEVYAI